MSSHPPLSPLSQQSLRQSFGVLDDERTGCITPHGLRTLLLSRGCRVTSDDVRREVEEARGRRRALLLLRTRQRRRRRGGDGSGVAGVDDLDYSVEATREGIDLELVLDILSQPRFRKQSTDNDDEEQLRRTFRLFDVDNTGYITLDNLRQVAKDVGCGDSRSGNGMIRSMDDDLLLQMVEAFDRDLDGAISYDEFRAILTRNG